MASSTPTSSRRGGVSWRGEGMRSRGLLIAGLVAIAVSVVGPGVEGAVGGIPGWWGGPMFGQGHMSGYMHGRGHMGWWDDTTSPAPLPNARELVVTATDFAFSPAELPVEVGEPVNLTLVNQGAIPHDLSIPELGVHVTAAPGARSTTGFIATETGSFQILCTYPGHSESGMTGVLLVGVEQ